MPDMQDTLRKMASGEIPPPPIAQLIGFRVNVIQHGQANAEFHADERHANPMGTLHGGVLCDVTDAAMGMAFASTLQENESFTTLELKINFLKPIWKAKLRANARVVKSGKSVGLVECDVIDEQDQLVARASSTCMVLRGAEVARR